MTEFEKAGIAGFFIVLVFTIIWATYMIHNDLTGLWIRLRKTNDDLSSIWVLLGNTNETMQEIKDEFKEVKK